MVGKPFTVLVYLVIGLLIAVWPIAAQWARQSGYEPARALRRLAERPWAAGRVRRFIGSYSRTGALILGLLIGSTLPWWRASYTKISITEGCVYGVVIFLSLILLAPQLRSAPISEGPSRWRWIPLTIVVLFFFVLSFTTGILAQPEVLMTSWHHWGAFIGPSELMLSGARIFHDFSAQYGFGPTLLIAASCGENCWLGMHYVVAATTMFFASAVLYIVARSNVGSLGAYCVLLATVLAVCFLWSAFPPVLASPREFPSVSGLRFLPAILLVTALVWADSYPSLSRHWATIGHAAYAIGALWSPESLFFVSVVWWPYFIWRYCADANPRQFPGAIAQAVAILLVVCTAILLGFLTIYRQMYGVFPSAGAYLAYMLYPPGELPIDPKGPIWFSATAIVLGVISTSQLLFGGGKRADIHRNFLVLLLSYATLSYCMGRSHSNNFLNVLPFTAMVLVNVLTARLHVFFRAIAAGMLVSLLGWLSVFGWNLWAATIEANRVLEFQPRQLVASFSFADAPTALSKYLDITGAEDFKIISRAISEIRASSNDPIEVVDNRYLVLPTSPPQVWAAYHGPVNFYFMPREWRLRFLMNTRDRLGRSGWLIISHAFAPEWLEDFQSAYVTTQELDFGSYHALHFSPRK